MPEVSPLRGRLAGVSVPPFVLITGSEGLLAERALASVLAELRHTEPDLEAIRVAAAAASRAASARRMESDESRTRSSMGQPMGAMRITSTRVPGSSPSSIRRRAVGEKYAAEIEAMYP